MVAKRSNVHAVIKLWRKVRQVRERADSMLAGAEARLLKLIPRQACIDNVFHRVSRYLHADEAKLKGLGLLRKVQSPAVDARKLRRLADELPLRYVGPGRAIVPELRHALIDLVAEHKAICKAVDGKR